MFYDCERSKRNAEGNLQVQYNKIQYNINNGSSMDFLFEIRNITIETRMKPMTEYFFKKKKKSVKYEINSSAMLVLK